MASTKALVGVSPIYARILSLFPADINFCFAYGSGVVKQSGSNAKNSKMIDMIFAVNDSLTWHRQNMEMNPNHYSFLKWLGEGSVAAYQDHWGAKVYFNTLVPIPSENVMIKYGVVSQTALVSDLLDWSELYLAGRLHKPVMVVRPTSDSELRSALQKNLHSAIHCALLLLPEHFTEKLLYKTIIELSYKGDFRMIIGEDKNKVNNILDPQFELLQEIYRPILKSLHDYVDVQESGLCCQDPGTLAKLHHLNQLPRTPQRALVRFWNRGCGNLRQDTEDVLRAVAHDPDCSSILQSRIQEIVWASSVRQSLKGILTAGIFKSIQYSAQKIKKMLASTRQIQ
ncbi:hypothetical protein ONE63_001149 [Megalurothrips usitatus]|uniref:Phosphatidate cytidylyltransferase, mitochondrial n=1 Tax=Megalurothrips usitatus TaxID=439358 RepID=A0AAV7XF89_9NEOP|nr:hypothetical protein ONE63_001149 [Megalurothrips usitatus]